MGPARHTGLDAARGLGIAFVFYGHLAEKLALAGSVAAAAHWKWIYAFHMPLFFFLSGILWRPPDAPARRWLGERLRRRLLPVLTFNAIALPLWATLLDSRTQWIAVLAPYAYGQPLLNWITWFLICLFMLECWLALLDRGLPLTRRGNVPVAAWGALVAGVAAIAVQTWLSQWGQLRANAWFVLEGVVAAPFALVGLACRPWLMAPRVSGRDAVAILVGGAFLFATFGENTGFRREPVVVMATANHGLWWWFYPTALAGACFAAGLGRVLAPLAAPLVAVGRLSLFYLGLSGLAFTFVEPRLVQWLGAPPESHGAVLLVIGAYVAVALGAGYPLAVALRRGLPRWFGLPARAAEPR